MIVKGNLKYLNDIVAIENSIFLQPWSRIHFEKDLQHSAGYSRFFIEHNQCSAYLFGYSLDNEFHLNNIAVNKKQQNRGIASLLVRDLLKYCKKKKINKILLEVRCDNVIAINLYEKFNFKKINIRKDYYKKGKDAFLYNLEII